MMIPIGILNTSQTIQGRGSMARLKSRGVRMDPCLANSTTNRKWLQNVVAILVACQVVVLVTKKPPAFPSDCVLNDMLCSE